MVFIRIDAFQHKAPDQPDDDDHKPDHRDRIGKTASSGKGRKIGDQQLDQIGLH